MTNSTRSRRIRILVTPSMKSDYLMNKHEGKIILRVRTENRQKDTPRIRKEPI